ncbi:MAG: endonuclease III [Alphaproteobacteria bacterium]|nr:endonuclease III [Alphaproteobacteria bacterium]
MKPADVDEFFRRLCEANPEPRTELDAPNAYTFLVSVVLSAQTTDKGVNKATAPLYKKVKTPEQMLELGEEGLKDYIRAIGFYNVKAKSVMKLSQALVNNFGGEVPQTQKELMSLPGVGRKSANVVLNQCFGQAVIAVDRHVLRVANRTGLGLAESPEEVEEQLMKIIPAKWRRHAHHWLVLHGRYVCTAKKPNCPDCIVNDLCAYKFKTK